jgi:hypothetical protein
MSGQIFLVKPWSPSSYHFSACINLRKHGAPSQGEMRLEVDQLIIWITLAVGFLAGYCVREMISRRRRSRSRLRW